MKSHIYGATTLNPSATVTNYNWITSTNLAAWNATQTNRDTVIPHTLILDQLRVTCVTAPTTGKSITYTIMKNGAATALTCTISDTAQAAQDLTHTVSFTAGDTISIRTTVSGTPTLPSGVYWSIRQDATSLQALIGGASQNAAANGNNYNGLQSSAGWMATETSVYSPMPTGGSLTNLYIMSSAAPGVGNDRTFTIMVNGSPSAVTCSLGAAGTTANDTLNNVAINAGDTVSIQSSVTGIPNTANIAWACSFAPTNDGESVLLYGDSASPSISATNYEQPMGRGTDSWSATESARFLMVAASTIENIYVLLTVAPGATKSYVFTLDINSIPTSATTTIANTATSNSTVGLSVTVNDDDLLDLSTTPVLTPAATAVKSGILFFIAPPIAVTSSGSTLMMMGV